MTPVILASLKAKEWFLACFTRAHIVKTGIVFCATSVLRNSVALGTGAGYLVLKEHRYYRHPRSFHFMPEASSLGSLRQIRTAY